MELRSSIALPITEVSWKEDEHDTVEGWSIASLTDWRIQLNDGLMADLLNSVYATHYYASILPLYDAAVTPLESWKGS